MGLVSGGLNGRRFRITTPLPEGFRDLFLEGARSYAFPEPVPPFGAEPLVGWVNLFDPADRDIELNSLLYDRYVALSMRVDKKAVNGKFFQIALTRRIAEVCEERGIEKLSKDQKQDIKDALEAELLRQALPSVSLHDIAWDTHTGDVIVFATSEATLELFRGLVDDSFGVRLHPERMVDWLYDKLDYDEVVQRVDTFLPGGAIPTSGEEVDGWREANPLDGHEHRLGSDFITWLWLQSEATDGLFRVLESPSYTPSLVGDDDDPWNDVTETLKRADMRLWLDTRLKMQELGDADIPETTILLGAAPSTTEEARRNLLTGKRPTEARLGLAVGDLECAMLLQATPGGLAISGLKMPFEVKTGTDEKVIERMGLLDMVHTTLKGLFKQFFLNRTSPDWQERVERWLEEDLAAK